MATSTSTQLILVICCWCAVTRTVATLPLTLEEDNSKMDSLRLKELLKQLSSLDDQSNSVSPTTTSLPETDPETAKIHKPSKRNCQIGLSNDCGSAHSAYMAGMKNFLGSKRVVEDSSSTANVGTPLSDWDAVLQIPRASDREFASDGSSRDEMFENVMLRYLRQLTAQRYRELENYERLCLMLTGQACGWQSERDGQ